MGRVIDSGKFIPELPFLECTLPSCGVECPDHSRMTELCKSCSVWAMTEWSIKIERVRLWMRLTYIDICLSNAAIIDQPLTLSFPLQEELMSGEEVARCPSCSLIIKVIYDQVKTVPSSVEGVDHKIILLEKVHGKLGWIKTATQRHLGRFERNVLNTILWALVVSLGLLWGRLGNLHSKFLVSTVLQEDFAAEEEEIVAAPQKDLQVVWETENWVSCFVWHSLSVCEPRVEPRVIIALKLSERCKRPRGRPCGLYNLWTTRVLCQHKIFSGSRNKSENIRPISGSRGWGAEPVATLKNLSANRSQVAPPPPPNNGSVWERENPSRGPKVDSQPAVEEQPVNLLATLSATADLVERCSRWCPHRLDQILQVLYQPLLCSSTWKCARFRDSLEDWSSGDCSTWSK